MFRFSSSRPCFADVLLFGLFVSLLLGLPFFSHAATFQCSDVPCLIARITQANLSPAPDTIELAAGIYTLTQPAITAPAPYGLPAITSAITIRGASSQTTLLGKPQTQDEGTSFAYFLVTNTGTFTLQGVALRHGNGMYGGAIRTFGTLVLDEVQLYNNFAYYGGALAVMGGQTTITQSMLTDNMTVPVGGGLYVDAGDVTIIGSTIADNYAQVEGGGLANGYVGSLGGTVTVRNSALMRNATDGFSTAIVNYGVLDLTNTTVSQNDPVLDLSIPYSAIQNQGGTLFLVNSTIAENHLILPTPEWITTRRMAGVRNPNPAFARDTVIAGGMVFLVNTILAGHDQDCAGEMQSWGNNLIGDPAGCTITLQASDRTGDPGLGALIDIGEPGYAHLPLLAGSQAINQAGWWLCPFTDQLGHTRRGRCDIGAIEYQGISGMAQAVFRRVVAIGRGR